MTPEQELELLKLRRSQRLRTEAPPSVQPAPDSSGPDGVRSTVLGFANGGTANTADEIGGLIGKMLIPEGVRLTSEAKRLAAEKGVALPPEASSYELVRDGMRREAKMAKEEHPYLYGGGNLAGGVALAAIAPGGGAKTIAQMARTGAVYGAANALGESEAMGARGLIQDTADGAGGGAILGAGGGALLKGAPTAARWLSGKLRNYAIDKGRIVLTNGAGQLSTKAPLADSAVSEALRSGAILPFGTNKGALDRLSRTTDMAGDTYGATLDSLQGAYNDAASMLASRRLAPGNQAGRLGLRQAENIKRSLQAKVPYTTPNAGEMNDARARIASIVRQANEDAVDEAGKAAGASGHVGSSPLGVDVKELADSFVPQKQRLGNLIAARDAAEAGYAAGAKRTGSGMPGAMEIGNAMMSGQPAVMLAKPASQIIKTRLPSTLASGSYLGSYLSGAAVGPLQRAIQSDAIRSAVARESVPVAHGLFGAGRALKQSIAETPDEEEQRLKLARANYLADALRASAGGE